MSDNQDTQTETCNPKELITVPDSDIQIPREDYGILSELFSFQPDAIIARTGETVPRYFTRSGYNPKYPPGRISLEGVAEKKATLVCRRDYPQYTARDMNNLYNKAKAIFGYFWVCLEDEKNAAEVDEQAASQIYIKEFMEAYIIEVHQLDREHPKNLQAHHEDIDRYVAFIQEYQKEPVRNYEGRPRPFQDYSDYHSVSPRWKQIIAADGRNGGREAAQEDAEIGMGFREGSELEKLAGERFTKQWKDLTSQMYFEMQRSFDHLGLRSIYGHNFIRTYTEEAESGQDSVQLQETGARIVTSHLDQDTRVYLIEINDPQHLTAPVRVEVAVKSEGDVQIRGETDDAK
jgi:hypothetical protein